LSGGRRDLYVTIILKETAHEEKVALIIATTYLCMFTLARSQNPRTIMPQDSVVVNSNEFSNIQQLLDVHAARGYRVSSVLYKSSVKICIAPDV
jgi:hypothetical protein